MSSSKSQQEHESFWQKHTYSLLAPVVLVGLLWAFSLTEYYYYLEYPAENVRYRLRQSEDPPAHPDVMIVGISEDGLDMFGRWPWPRHKHGDFLELLSLRPPSVVLFDLFFPEKSRDPSHDQAFGEAMTFHEAVITGALTRGLTDKSESRGHKNEPRDAIAQKHQLKNIKGDVSQIYGESSALFPVEPLHENGLFGFVDVEGSKIDGIRRKYPMIVRVGEEVYPSVGLMSMVEHWDTSLDEVEVALGDAIRLPRDNNEILNIPIDEKGMYLINYRREGSFVNVHYYQLFKKLFQYYQSDSDEWANPSIDPEGKILAIGQVAAGLTDLGPTPLEGRSPLVRVQANVIDNLLKEDFIQKIASWKIALSLLVLLWVTLFLLKNKGFVLTIGVPTLILMGYVFLTYVVFAEHSLQLPLVWPTLAFFFGHSGAFYLQWRQEANQKKRIKGMFGTYLSPELVNQLVESGDEPQLGGVDVEISAFFSDVQSFSSFSEKLTPQQLVDIMNEYLTAMTKVLMDRGCYVDKYIGDAIVGIFNAPVDVENHALEGCISCMEQHKRLEELRQKWKSEGDKWPPIVHNMQARMGINTGFATVGNMGSEDRFNYTMMGDTVNLAARCESGAKAYGVYTMVTGETKEAACKSGDDCVFRYLDKIVVKGRSQPAEMYEVVCLREDMTLEIEQCLNTYEKGIQHFLNQEWDAAYDQFMKSAQLEPNRKERNPNSPTTPSEVMAERSQEMKANPPGADWDGVYVMTSK